MSLEIGISMGSKKYTFENSVEVKDNFYIPILPNIVDPPTDNTIAAIGYYNNTQYTWNITEQAWKETGPGDTISGTETIVADGSDSVFAWAHGLGFDPTTTGYTIDPQTAESQGIYSKSADGTEFTVTYDVCPVGTLIFNWTAKQP